MNCPKTYENSFACRSKEGASSKQLKLAASLLKAAAGVNVIKAGDRTQENALLPQGDAVEIYPGIHVAASTHLPALKVLSKLYFQGGKTGVNTASNQANSC